ncbi:holin [Hafnia phage yong3]|nr:holin [Hafnia phage yong3]
MIQFDPEGKWLTAAVFAVISFVGGALGYVMRTLDAGGKVTLVRTLLEGLSSAFFGFVIGMVYVDFSLSWGFAFALVSVLAWIGSRATIKKLEPFLLKKLGLKPASEECRHENDSK